MEKWEEEISRYAERITKIGNWRPDFSNLLERLPDIPLNYSPSPQGSVAINLSVYVLNCIQFAHQAIKSFLVMWRDECFITLSLPTRLVYEIWGATHFARRVLLQMHDSGEVDEEVSEKVKRLLLGARSELRLPWGGTAEEISINVITFIKSLTDIYPQAEDVYGFLCESCHPSYLRLTTWSMVGPPLQNWTNEIFREQGHDLIDKTLYAIEQALEGIAYDTTKTLELALSYIDADRLDKSEEGST